MSSETYKNIQKNYRSNYPQVRIDAVTYAWIKNYSENNEIKIKDVIKISVEDFKENLRQENDLLKTENESLKKDIEQLKLENESLKKDIEQLKLENESLKKDILKGKEKKGLREGLKGIFK